MVELTTVYEIRWWRNWDKEEISPPRSLFQRFHCSVLVLTIMERRNLPCPMVRCKYLTLDIPMKKWVLPGIAILLQSCPQVEILNIKMDFPHEVVLTIMERRNLPFPMMRCKYLTLDTPMKKWDLPGIAVLLQSCCQVEILNIKMDFPYEVIYYGTGFEEESNDLNEKNYWISRSCWVLHLKTFRIHGFWIRGNYYGQLILSFLQAVLKNAMVLEKIIIDSFKDDPWIPDVHYRNVADKLLSFSSSSRDATILFSG